MSQFTLGSIIRKGALLYPNKTVIASNNVRYSYKMANEEVNRIVNWLKMRDVKPGDRVAIFMENNPVYALLIFAIAKLGAIMVPINIRLHEKEINFILRDCTPKIIISSELMEGVISPSSKENNISLIMDYEIIKEIENYDSNEPNIPIDELEPYTIMYTSGTTGFPKGCVATHLNWIMGNNNINNFLKNSSNDAYLAVLPLFHVAGFGAFLSVIHFGGKVVFGSPKFEPRQAYELIDKEKITILFLLEPLLSQFIDAEAYDETKIHSINSIMSLAGVVPQETVWKTKKLLNCNYIGIYGQTETSSIVTAIFYDEKDTDRNDVTLYGKGLPNFEYKLSPIDTGEENVGELLVRGSSNIGGYWENVVETEELLKEGWLHTGDIFQQHINGSLEMVDRSKYLIKTGGENVYPREVEKVLIEHEAVSDVAVIGIPDATWGEAIKAFVVLKEEKYTKNIEIDLSEWCKMHLTGYKKPKYYEFIKEIPRNHSGKILKNQLK